VRLLVARLAAGLLGLAPAANVKDAEPNTNATVIYYDMAGNETLDQASPNPGPASRLAGPVPARPGRMTYAAACSAITSPRSDFSQAIPQPVIVRLGHDPD
jgi:hypothetical protein